MTVFTLFILTQAVIYWFIAVAAHFSLQHDLYYGTGDVAFDDSKLLHWVKEAQHDLKVYIYQMPDFPMGSSNEEGCHGNSGLDCGFFRYLRSIPDLIVEDQAKANAFFIELIWRNDFSLEAEDCSTFIEHRLRPVVYNVVHKQPYYNQSQGRNHFMMSLTDNGIFAEKA